jgi:hypothetical protein
MNGAPDRSGRKESGRGVGLVAGLGGLFGGGGEVAFS